MLSVGVVAGEHRNSPLAEARSHCTVVIFSMNGRDGGPNRAPGPFAFTELLIATQFAKFVVLLLSGAA